MSQIRTVKTVIRRRTNPQRNNRININRKVIRNIFTNRNSTNRSSNTQGGQIRPARRIRLSSRPNPYLYPPIVNRTPARATQQSRTLVFRNRNRTAVANALSGPNKDYIMCRIAPFIANGANSGIPDGSMQRKVMIDHRLQIPFVLGETGSMNIAITPNIPCPVCFKASHLS